MFDDPKKELQRIQQALWEEETQEEAFDEEALSADDPEQEAHRADFARMYYADEEFDEDAALLAPPNGRRGLKKAQRKARKQEKKQLKDKKKEKKKKRRSAFGLLITVLEILAFVALLRWWTQWLT